MTIYDSLILLGTLIPAILFVAKKLENKWRTNKIINFLTESIQTTTYNFRSTHVISVNTNIPTNDIRDLCSKSKRVKRNTLKKEIWRLR